MSLHSSFYYTRWNTLRLRNRHYNFPYLSLLRSFVYVIKSNLYHCQKKLRLKFFYLYSPFCVYSRQSCPKPLADVTPFIFSFTLSLVPRVGPSVPRAQDNRSTGLSSFLSKPPRRLSLPVLLLCINSKRGRLHFIQKPMCPLSLTSEFRLPVYNPWVIYNRLTLCKTLSLLPTCTLSFSPNLYIG